MINVITLENIANNLKTFMKFFYVIYGKDIYEGRKIIMNKLKATQSISYMKAHLMKLFRLKKKKTV